MTYIYSENIEPNNTAVSILKQESDNASLRITSSAFVRSVSAAQRIQGLMRVSSQQLVCNSSRFWQKHLPMYAFGSSRIQAQTLMRSRSTTANSNAAYAFELRIRAFQWHEHALNSRRRSSSSKIQESLANPPHVGKPQKVLRIMTAVTNKSTDKSSSIIIFKLLRCLQCHPRQHELS